MSKNTQTKPVAVTPTDKPLILTVNIPAKVAPLFRAMAALQINEHEERTRRRGWTVKGGRRVDLPEIPGEVWTLDDVASHGVTRWMVSEEAQEMMDRIVNKILRGD